MSLDDVDGAEFDMDRLVGRMSPWPLVAQSMFAAAAAQRLLVSSVVMEFLARVGLQRVMREALRSLWGSLQDGIPKRHALAEMSDELIVTIPTDTSGQEAHPLCTDALSSVHYAIDALLPDRDPKAAAWAAQVVLGAIVYYVEEMSEYSDRPVEGQWLARGRIEVSRQARDLSEIDEAIRSGSSLSQAARELQERAMREPAIP